jgi:hypothetical protein
MPIIMCVQISGNRSIALNLECRVHSDHFIHKTCGTGQSKNFKYQKERLNSRWFVILFLITLYAVDRLVSYSRLDLLVDKPTRELVLKILWEELSDVRISTCTGHDQRLALRSISTCFSLCSFTKGVPFLY